MPDPQRLIIVAPDFYPRTGGYAHAATNLARSLAPHMPVTVLCSIPLGEEQEIEVAGLEVVRRTASGWQLASGAWGLSASTWLADRARSGDVRAVLLETAESPVLGLRALRLAVPVLLRIHAAAETELAWHERGRFRFSDVRGSIWRTYHYAMMRRLLRKAPVVLSTSRYHLDFVKRVALAGSSVEISRRSFYVLPNVVLLPEEGRPPALPMHLAGAAQGRFLLTLGRLDEQGVEQKGFRDLLQAFALARRHDPTLADTALIMVGDGPQRGALEQYARSLGLGPSVALFSGGLPHDVVVHLTTRAHAVVLLSRYEGQAMFALESLALGAPLVLTETGGLIGLVLQGQNGFAVPPQDIPAAEQALRQVLHGDRDQMSAESVRLFQETFAPERAVETLDDILHVVAPIVTAKGCGGPVDQGSGVTGCRG